MLRTLLPDGSVQRDVTDRKTSSGGQSNMQTIYWCAGFNRGPADGTWARQQCGASGTRQPDLSQPALAIRCLQSE